MKSQRVRETFALVLILFPAAFQFSGNVAAQEKPLQKTFVPGSVQRYRVELTVRNEVEGVRAIEGGGNSYAESFSRRVIAKIDWVASREVTDFKIGEKVDLFEQMNNIRFTVRAEGTIDAETDELARGLREELTRWTGNGERSINYSETGQGKLTGVPGESAPWIDEKPTIISLWLLRALRPTVTLPDRPVRFNEPWTVDRSIELEPWKDIKASESTEWLPVPSEHISVNQKCQLHVAQQIDGKLPEPAGPKRPGKVTFHAESLTTIVLTDPGNKEGGVGVVLYATRSATREVTHVLDPIPGLAEPPVFRGRISAEVRITRLE